MIIKLKHICDVYLDHAASTPVRTEVYKAMEPFFVTQYGNPSALYKLGVRAHRAIEQARKTIAEILHTQPDTIVFTSGGTEANNLAIFGVTRVSATASPHPALSRGERGVASFPPRGEVLMQAGHIISTPSEHHSVLHPIQELEKQGHGKFPNGRFVPGWDVTHVKVDKKGLVNPRDVIAAIRPDTVLISIIYANNEIGTIEPIAEIGRQLLRYRKEHNSIYPYLHTDACQAAGYLSLDVEKLHVDLMTINGSKIYGPKGVGMIYVRRGVKIIPLILGGSQERRLRGGTENVPGIVGLAKALELAQCPSLSEGRRRGGGSRDEAGRLRDLTIYFWQQIQKKISKVSLNGPEIGEHRLPNNLNITIDGVEGEMLLLYLDSYGISCSVGSACAAEEAEPSQVLAAIGRSPKEVSSSVRFTLGRSTMRQDIDYVMKYLPQLVSELRRSGAFIPPPPQRRG